jgi:hypothetical protein
LPTLGKSFQEIFCVRKTTDTYISTTIALITKTVEAKLLLVKKAITNAIVAITECRVIWLIHSLDLFSTKVLIYLETIIKQITIAMTFKSWLKVLQKIGFSLKIKCDLP